MTPIFTQRGQHINRNGQPWVTLSSISETQAATQAWNLTRWLRNGWVSAADVEANSVNGLILDTEYDLLMGIMDNRPEVVS